MAQIPFLVSLLARESTEWWLLASIPAGAAAGATAGPHVRPGRRLPIRHIAGSAVVAFLVGDALVSLAVALLYAQQTEWSLVDIVVNVAGMALLGLITVGWLAMFVLLPIAAIGAAVLRARLGSQSKPI